MTYLIHSEEESELQQESMYWSNEDGWVDRDSATIFSSDEKNTLHLPLSGNWVVNSKETK